MKRLLALSLMLISAGAMAQNSSNKGCRVLIGEDWIPMGATTVSGCLKYAEAAATPGERQFAQFGATQLSFKDGQSFQSADDGKTWQPIRGGSEGSVGSLNTLRADGDEGKPAQKSKAEPAPSTTPPAPTRTAQAATPSTPIMPELEAPVPLQDNAPAAPVGSREVQMAPAAQAPRYRPEAAPATPATSTATAPVMSTPSGNAAAEINQSVPRGCQVHVGEQWQVTPVGSVEECGRILVNVAQRSGAKSSQAYWAGNYLFYTGGQLYHSTNGQDWHTLR